MLKLNFFVFAFAGISKSGPSKERKKKNGGSTSNSTNEGSNKAKEGSTNISHHVTALLNAGNDATNTDRAAVWKAVNGAMANLVVAATAVNNAGSAEHPSYLLPSPFTCAESPEDEGIGTIPLLVDASSTATTAAEPPVEGPQQ
ncbi:unnamed protein product [Hydatigera taeniaeformis]|uniref:Uncharacterized protein n=1 Tax=Hydatigena taeniaeformis TaxID=6205 RepID=A0A0R3WZ55_HYDTA|nr:unnamed protein product [Hydatigera taeniaeformis]